MSDTIQDWLFRWGAWRTQGLRAQPIRGAAMYTPGATDVRGRYRQPCQPCYGRGVDLSAVGCRVLRLEDLPELKKQHPCPVCKGRGYETVGAMKADPGAIRRTGPGGMHIPADDMPQDMVELEAAMDARLSPINRFVLVARYVAYPRLQASSQSDGRKARVAWVNQAIAPDRISESSFKERLSLCHRLLSDETGAPMKQREYRNAS